MKPDFLIIPRQLYDEPEMEPSDRDVYGVVYWFERLKDGKCTANNQSIAGVIHISERAVQNALTKLEKFGFIERVYRDKSKRQRMEIKTKISFQVVRSTGDTVRSVGDTRYEVRVTRESNSNKEKKDITEKREAPSPKDFFSDPLLQGEIVSFLVGKGWVKDFAESEMRKFVSYWTEPNKGGTKVRWEGEQYFDIRRRVATWFSRVKSYQKSQFPRESKSIIL